MKLSMNRSTGYAHPDYAEVYRDQGMSFRLLASGGSVLLRAIPSSDFHDAMGCYPIFCCEDWDALRDDLKGLKPGCVSLVLVADPFLEGGAKTLSPIFDQVRPFKTHYVADLDRPIDSYVPRSRLRAANKAFRKLELDIIENSESIVSDWLSLQDVSRHESRLSGVNRLTREATERLFGVPGIVVLRAQHDGETVGMHVEMHQGEVVFGHFAGYSPLGYQLGASTALHVFEIEHFVGRARWIDWGGVPGRDDFETGLSQFKRNFSNSSRVAYLCGSVLDPKAYAALSAPLQSTAESYFPAYRANELVSAGMTTEQDGPN